MREKLEVGELKREREREGRGGHRCGGRVRSNMEEEGMHRSCPKLSRDQKIITAKADNSNLTQHCKNLSSFCQLCIQSSFLFVGEGNVTQLVKN